MDKIGIPAHPNTSDTINAGGIMRGLRTVPIFMDIINDMAEKCEPGALDDELLQSHGNQYMGDV